MPDERNIFEQIGDLLPSEHREDWFRTTTRMRKMNDDDDLLAIIKVISVSGLITRETPEKIAELLGKLDQSLIADRNEHTHTLRASVDEIRSALARDRTENAEILRSSVGDIKKALNEDEVRREVSQKRYARIFIGAVLVALLLNAGVASYIIWKVRATSHAQVGTSEAASRLSEALAADDAQLTFATTEVEGKIIQRIGLGPLKNITATPKDGGGLVVQWDGKR